MLDCRVVTASEGCKKKDAVMGMWNPNACSADGTFLGECTSANLIEYNSRL